MINSQVIVYTSDDCSNCGKVLEKLSEWDVDFEERNVTEDREYFKELQKQKVYGTPATFINGEKVLGYQEHKLKRILGIPYEDRFMDRDYVSFS